ncbi:RNA chaperone Hfq [Hazenella sp. IB182357]|uniref:RNA-binding protein Hfq n=1 Tax=Polycladospora coralii TaxID=2771432 RepID=A0A926N8E4_9BACL|nr:RNA chaperone Hfq [Polycladospora coralii]MBD1373961.1 RNA chaperone Hfq [Polycladospora coralii]
MAKKQLNIQEAFLSELKNKSIPCTMFLTNGFQYKGKVIGFDTYSVMLEADGKQQVVFKHVISTIVPSKKIDTRQYTG